MDAVKCEQWINRQCLVGGGCSEICARIPAKAKPIAVRKTRMRRIAEQSKPTSREEQQ